MVCAHTALDENITVGALVPLDTDPSFFGLPRERQGCNQEYVIGNDIFPMIFSTHSLMYV